MTIFEGEFDIYDYICILLDENNRNYRWFLYDIMEYRLDNYTRDPQLLAMRLAGNCKARRLEKGYSRRRLSELTGIPAPTIERFERTGKLSLESFCRLAVEFDYFDELGAVMERTKYTTAAELETIIRNQNRKNGR